MDRSRPAKPSRAPVGYQRWRDLSFLHWSLDPGMLREWIPSPLEIDTWNGLAWIGVVPFRMEGIRPWWSPPLPYLCAFPETNLRTYVHFDGVPGVWFFSLEASRLIAVLAARIGWGLNYRWAAMEVTKADRSCTYRSRRILEPRIETSVDTRFDPDQLFHARQETFEHFLCERYFLYTLRSGRRIFRGQVYHEPYPLHPAEATVEKQTLTHFFPCKLKAPEHVLFSHGVDVSVYGLDCVGTLG